MRFLRYFPRAERATIGFFRIWGKTLLRLKGRLSIDNDAKFSRHVYSPFMGVSALDADIRWENLFAFPSGNDQMESLVWRRFAPDSGCVDSLGLAFEVEGKKKYSGFRSAKASQILSYRNLHGHGARFIHAPEEGIQHAHITYFKNPDRVLTKNDRLEIREKLKDIFGEVTEYPPDLAKVDKKVD